MLDHLQPIPDAEYLPFYQWLKSRVLKLVCVEILQSVGFLT